MKKQRGFTLMEIMIVVILISVIAAFGLPAYNKSIDRASEKHAITQLKLIYSAIKLIQATKGPFPPESDLHWTYQDDILWDGLRGPFNKKLDDVNAINQALNLSIIPGNFTFNCEFGGFMWGEYACYATHTKGHWTLFFLEPIPAIACYETGWPCPSCPGNWTSCVSI